MKKKRVPVKMEAQVNTLYLLAQLQQKLQLDYKTNITQIRQKIELYGNATTKDLKKPRSSRWVGGAETWRKEARRGTEKLSGTERQQSGQSHTHLLWIKIRRDTSGAKDPSPRPDRSVQGSSAGKMSPHNFWL